MGLIKGVVTQSAADTTTQGIIATDLTVDGKTGWNITKFIAYLANGKTIAAADIEIEAILSTQATTVTTFNQSEEIARIEWTTILAGAAANQFPLEPIKSSLFLPGDRVTVQPYLYVTIASVASGQANVVYYAIEYDIVKLTDNELLRLAVGGS